MGMELLACGKGVVKSFSKIELESAPESVKSNMVATCLTILNGLHVLRWLAKC